MSCFVFARDLAAAVYDSCDVCAARMLPNTLAVPSVYVFPSALGQRPWGCDYLLEQEQRESDEVHGRYDYYQQPSPLSLISSGNARRFKTMSIVE